MNVIEALKSETQQIYNQLDSFTEEWMENYMSKNVRKVTRYLQENNLLHPYIISIEQGKSKGFG